MRGGDRRGGGGFADRRRKAGACDGDKARVEPEAAWGYDEPNAPFEANSGYVAFYAARMDACFVDSEQVTPQPGGFYGGWITSTVVGPFKGGPGSQGW